MRWTFERGKPTLLQPTLRHTVDSSELAALITCKDDIKYGQLARVESIENGIIIDNKYGRKENGIIMHLIFAFPEPDHGVWGLPYPDHQNTQPMEYHAGPHLFFRSPNGDNPARLQMELQGRGFDDLVRRYHMINNGSSRFVETYEILFGERIRINPSNYGNNHNVCI